MILDKARLKKLSLFSLPIVLGMMSQNLINLVDTIMLGHIGKEELAAVGISSIALSAFQALSFGVSDGVQAYAAKFCGMKKLQSAASTITTGLYYSLIFGSLIALFAVFGSEFFFRFIGLEGQLLEYSSQYFLARGAASIFASGNFAFRGFWNGVERSKTYLKILAVMHLTNLVGNFVLIYGFYSLPALGILGAAISSGVSITIGFFIFLIVTKKEFVGGKFDFVLFKKISSISIQSGFELLVTLSAMTIMFSVIESFGADALAAANILHNFFIFILYPVLGLGVAASSVAGNLRSQGSEEMRRWLTSGAALTFLLISVLTVSAAFGGRLLIQCFTSSESVIMEVLPAFYLTCATLPIEMIGYFLAQSLLGLGKPKEVLKITGTMLWGIFIPLLVLSNNYFKLDLLIVWIFLAGYRLAQTLWFSRKVKHLSFSLS